jgi:hypothetical protein
MSFINCNLNDFTNPNFVENVVSQVKNDSFVILRGLCNRDGIRKKIPLVCEKISNTNFLSSSGVTPEQIRSNIVKWSIGGQSAQQEGLSRFMVTCYNPMFCEDIFQMKEEFEKLIFIRDKLAGLDIIMTDDVLQKPNFNGTRLQIYPSGGGFLGGHIDSRAMDSIRDLNRPFIQLVLLVTEKGLDFQKGGAYVVNNKNEYIDTEKFGLSGDILVYDGNTMHGVADIDSDKPFEKENMLGRCVALATIYN